MHDPMTLAFRLRSPIRRKPPLFPDGYQAPLVEVWHVDPESDGSDDSCGWSYPRLTEKQRESLRGLAWSEAHEPWFQKLRSERNDDVLQCEALLRGAILAVANVLDIKVRWDEVCRWATGHAQRPLDNFRGGLCHLPGYHTNRDEDTQKGREETAFGLFRGLALHLLSERRPWWRHPRWHVHHWRLRFPILDPIRRALRRASEPA